MKAYACRLIGVGCFDNYVGWSEGVVTLMNVMGIECDFV